MSKTSKAVLAVLAIVVLPIVAIVIFLGLRDDGPDELVIGDRADDTEDVAEDAAGDTGDGDVPEEAILALVDIEGAWTLTGDSVAGYRVVEDFVGGVADFEAVGRTSTIEGDLTIEGTTVSEAEFSVDVASITSDDSTRDNQFRGPILNAEEFPTSDFVLTSPIDLGDTPGDGEVITVEATGELTLRDATVEVTFPLDASLVGDEVQVAGAIDVVFADFGIDNPSNPFVTVRDEGVVEFSLFFELA